MVSPPRCNVDWHGLISLLMISKARSCAKRVCMIVVGHVPIAQVSGSFHFGRVWHEVIDFSIRREACAARNKVGINGIVCVETHELSLFACLHLSELWSMCTGERLSKRVWTRERPSVSDLVTSLGTALYPQRGDASSSAYLHVDYTSIILI